jgi:hypothetical protein
MTDRNRPVRARSPWPANATGEVPYERPVARQAAPYQCTRGHDFTVTFAAEITPPGEWECRCGAPAVGATPPAGPESEHDRRMGQVLGRRSRAELEGLLTDRLAEIREA